MQHAEAAIRAQVNKNTLRKALVSAVAILIVIVGLVLGRNYQLDSAATALKLGSGVTAVGMLKPLAVLGDRNAQILLGYTYAYGWAGVPENDDEAMHWFSREGLFGTRLPDTDGGRGASEALSVSVLRTFGPRRS